MNILFNSEITITSPAELIKNLDLHKSGYTFDVTVEDENGGFLCIVEFHKGVNYFEALTYAINYRSAVRVYIDPIINDETLKSAIKASAREDLKGKMQDWESQS